jgi:glycosyltransferase involved in cell wall biosynthesis
MNYRGCYEKRRENMPQITVLTLAYNAERTLRRAVDSILTQTYRDFEYIVIDHGSTDGTRAIVQHYEKKDKRVRGIYLDENGINNGDFNYAAKLIVNHLKDSQAQWGVLLDSDDKYAPDALRHMLEFAEKNACDVVACGSDFVSAKTGATRMQRMTQNNMFLHHQGDFSSQFPVYHQFVRTYWAKMISLDIFRNPEFTVEKKNIIGDTGIMLAVFESAHKVGFLAEPLHTWYVSDESTSFKLMTQGRVEFNIYCYTRAIDFLKTKCGSVSTQNHEFMLCVFMNELKDSLGVLIGADMPQAEKLSLLRDMFLCEHARTLAAYERFGARLGGETQLTQQRRELFGSAAAWLLSREEVADEQVEGYCELGEFLCAAAENANGWIFFKKLLARFLVDQGRLDEAKPKLDELAELLPEDMETAELRAAARA